MNFPATQFEQDAEAGLSLYFPEQKRRVCFIIGMGVSRSRRRQNEIAGKKFIVLELPDGQTVHNADESSEYCPALHAVQEADNSPEYFPASHVLQEVKPEEPLN